jgi:hypothetical protein
VRSPPSKLVTVAFGMVSSMGLASAENPVGHSSFGAARRASATKASGAGGAPGGLDENVRFF